LEYVYLPDTERRPISNTVISHILVKLTTQLRYISSCLQGASVQSFEIRLLGLLPRKCVTVARFFGFHVGEDSHRVLLDC